MLPGRPSMIGARILSRFDIPQNIFLKETYSPIQMTATTPLIGYWVKKASASALGNG